jgi:hypothetical protein
MEWASDRAVSEIVTVRSTRIVQLPERKECVPSYAAGFAMLSLNTGLSQECVLVI